MHLFKFNSSPCAKKPLCSALTLVRSAASKPRMCVNSRRSRRSFSSGLKSRTPPELLQHFKELGAFSHLFHAGFLAVAGAPIWKKTH